MNNLNSLTIEYDLTVGGVTSTLCKCSCGKRFIVSKYLLKRGNIDSCGCLLIPQVEKKLTKTKVYKLWVSIKRRCRDPKYSKYKEYGGKGIDIDESWFNNFHEFYKEVGDYPEGLTLILKDEKKGYSSGNCKWVYISKK